MFLIGDKVIQWVLLYVTSISVTMYRKGDKYSV